jgi:hypothetical protein
MLCGVLEVFLIVTHAPRVLSVNSPRVAHLFNHGVLAAGLRQVLEWAGQGQLKLQVLHM